ncbi:MAG: 16S rRNA (uracil(1498)-N(3))-methyltransferase [Marinifilaceae bacterium]
MHLFFTPDIKGNDYTMSKEESKHCVRVLRLKENDEIELIDGHGGFYHGRVVEASPSACKVHCFEKQEEFGKRNYKLTLAVAPTKNIDRTEWFLEKCTEIGTNKFVMLESAHSERKVVKDERLEKVIISAMKQSLKAYLPALQGMTAFKKFVDSCETKHKFIAHCNEGEKYRIEECYEIGENVTIMIGPEGDFSEQEVEYAVARGFKPITLGNSRLRTETAVIVACHTISFLNKV